MGQKHDAYLIDGQLCPEKMPHGQRISKGHPKQETARDPRFIARAASQRSQWDGSHLEIQLVVGFFGLWLGWAVGRLGAVTIFSFPKTDSKEKWSSSVPWFHHDGVSMLIKDACFLTLSNNLLSFIFFGGEVQSSNRSFYPGSRLFAFRFGEFPIQLALLHPFHPIFLIFWPNV